MISLLSGVFRRDTGHQNVTGREEKSKPPEVGIEPGPQDLHIDCVNSLETSRRDASKECTQSRFNKVKQVANNVPGIGI